MKEHAEEAMKELSIDGKSTTLADVLKLLGSVIYTSDDEIKKQKEEDIIYNVTNFIESLYHLEDLKVVKVTDIDTDNETTEVKDQVLCIEDFVLFCSGSNKLVEVLNSNT